MSTTEALAYQRAADLLEKKRVPPGTGDFKALMNDKRYTVRLLRHLAKETS